MQSISFSNIGSRPTNEDAYYIGENIFIVCDGAGGSPYGDVASKLACSAISDYFKINPTTHFDCEYLNKALQYSIAKFKETESRYPEIRGMSTTVVLIAFDADGAIIAWLGDSRLYHIRNNQILFVTEDHSLVNDLRKQGNTDEAHLKSIRNYITKALNANCTYQFSLHGISKAEIIKDDFFLLCTDGVLENITDEKINHIFSLDSSLEGIKENILKECEGKTKDNFTFEIIQSV